MSKPNKANPSQDTKAGRLSQDDAARQRATQSTSANGDRSPSRSAGTTGISNRETAREEAEERERFPPRGERPADSASAENDGPVGEGAGQNQQTSSKSGSRSGAQKAAESKYTERPQPASEKVDGAFGQEPKR